MSVISQSQGPDRVTLDWKIYTGSSEPNDGFAKVPEAPPWRRFTGEPISGVDEGLDLTLAGHLPDARDRAKGYVANDDVVDMVNAALYLRRPLLVSGRPGNGKSTLAYSIAHELQLGPVLHWPITSKSALSDALYHYDAIGRLQEANLNHAQQDTESNHAAQGQPSGTLSGLGRYIRLGPLGTALLARGRPRVLLIDEFDKSDVDLANDLLHVFEEGRFEIPELVRLPEDQQDEMVMTADPNVFAPVRRGVVGCREFPVVIITSNGEREFPTAFLRRCLHYVFEDPDAETLAQIVEARLGTEATARCGPLIERFLQVRERDEITTDQLLNACHMVMVGVERHVPPELQNSLLNPLADRLGR